jgi:hypothetical protein
MAQGSFHDPSIGIRRAVENAHAKSERRESPRLPLLWSVYIARSGAPHSLRSQTTNLSSRGFYCVLNERLTPGEHLECDLVVPTHISRSHDDVLFLRCQTQVVRVEKLEAIEEYGLACRIEDYRLIHTAGRQIPREPLWTDAELA